MGDSKLLAKNEKEIDSLVKIAGAFSENKGKVFGVQKCGMAVMKKGKAASRDGVKLPNNEMM